MILTSWVVAARRRLRPQPEVLTSPPPLSSPVAAIATDELRLRTPMLGSSLVY